jgi:hypothetical protein
MEINQIRTPDPATEYDADIAIMKAASKLHLWRDTENQHRNFSTIISKLCAIRNAAIPTLDIDPATSPVYMVDAADNGHIILDKYSVISLLHELAHHFGGSEADCVTYSEWVFAHAFPVAFSRLERDARGFLCKPGTGATITSQDIARAQGLTIDGASPFTSGGAGFNDDSETM